MTNNKGITLIALVITIIVLLILAGVSIAMLTGSNGILTQATKAGDQTAISEAKELAGLDLSAKISEYYEEKYVNDNTTVGDSIQSYVSGFTSSDTTKYTVSGTTITLVPKGEDNSTITGTIGTDGTITWSK